MIKEMETLHYLTREIGRSNSDLRADNKRPDNGEITQPDAVFTVKLTLLNRISLYLNYNTIMDSTYMEYRTYTKVTH